MEREKETEEGETWMGKESSVKSGAQASSASEGEVQMHVIHVVT